MTDMAAKEFSWARVAIAAALLMFAPFIVLTVLLVATGGHFDEIIWVWLGVSLAAGASGLWVIGISNWLRALLALAYVVTMAMPLLIYALAFGCGVYRRCP
jgi:hypothetical protein